MELDEIITEARARIIWGEEPASVRDFLVSNGMQESEAASALKGLCAERNREVRKIGARDAVIGAVLIGIAATLACCILESRRVSMSYGGAKALGMDGFLALIGVWRLVKGIVHLVRPQLEHTSIPDLTE